MKLPKLFLSLLLLGASLTTQAGGLSAWYEKTPYGHELYHDGTAEGDISLRLDTTSVLFQNFYFYKGHTIAYSDSSFLIINERTNAIQEFTDRKTWEAKLREQKLVPFIKRSYDANYSSFMGKGNILLLILLPFPFLLPVLWLICCISLIFPTRRFYRFRKHFVWLYPAVLLLAFLAESFPQSI